MIFLKRCSMEAQFPNLWVLVIRALWPNKNRRFLATFWGAYANIHDNFSRNGMLCTIFLMLWPWSLFIMWCMKDILWEHCDWSSLISYIGTMLSPRWGGRYYCHDLHQSISSLEKVPNFSSMISSWWKFLRNETVHGIQSREMCRGCIVWHF